VQAFSVISLHEKASSKEDGEEQHIYEDIFHAPIVHHAHPPCKHHS
jgi:hypothetical protein